MKNNSPLALTAWALLFSSLLFSGCKKESNDALTPAQEEEAVNFSTESQNESDLVFNDVFDNVMGVNTEVGIGGTGVFGRVSSGNPGGREMDTDSIPSCLTITVTRLNAPEPFPVKITMDFGTGCPGNDGHVRSGKIITEYTGRLIVPGKSATTRFEGFKFDSISVRGTHKITNTTAAGSHHAQFTVDITDARLERPNGDYSQWNSHRVITQTEGNATAAPGDDIFSITGSGHGHVSRGNHLYAWQSEIIEPLVKKFSCHWISKGIIKVRRETLPATSPWAASINFGNGDCDFLATVSFNGTTHQVQLPH